MRDSTARRLSALAVAAAAALAWRWRATRAPTEPIWDGWRYQQGAEAILRGELLSWNHVGMSLAAAPLVPVFHDRAAWVVSMAAGALGVVAAYFFVARAARSRAGGVVAAFLLATTPAHLYWSGTGHAGTLALLVALLLAIALQRGRGGVALALAIYGVSVRPDFVLLVPLFLALPAIDPLVPRRATRPLLFALPALAVVALAYLALHGARPDRFAWSVPAELAPADWDVRAKRKPDGTLGLGPAGATWSPGYAPANLLFYGDVLVDGVVRDWSGWVLHLPGNPLLAPLALAGAWASRAWRLALALVAVPFLGLYSVYYGFSPEYVLPLLVPALACAGVATERIARVARAALSKRASSRVPEAPLQLRPTARRGPPTVLDRFKSLFRSKEEAVTSPRLALLVLAAPGAEGALRDVGLGRPAVRASLGGAASDAAALKALWTGRASGEGPSVADVLRENDVSHRVLSSPLDLAPEATALALAARAVEERDARVVIAFAKSADGDGPDRARAALDEAVTQVAAALAPEDWLVVAHARSDGSGDVAIAGPGVVEPDSPPARVEWTDVAPTVFRALGVNVPEGLDGYAIEEAFPQGGWRPEDEKRVEEHLEKLGYL